MNAATFILKLSKQDFDLLEITDKKSAVSVDILKEALHYWKKENFTTLIGLDDCIKLLISDDSISSIPEFLKKGYYLQKLFGVRKK